MNIFYILIILVSLAGCTSISNKEKKDSKISNSLTEIDFSFYTPYYYIIDDDTTSLTSHAPSDMYRVINIGNDFLTTLYYDLNEDSVFITKLDDGMGLTLPLNDSIIYRIFPRNDNGNHQLVDGRLITTDDIGFYEPHSDKENVKLQERGISVILKQLPIDKIKLVELNSLIDKSDTPIYKHSVALKDFIPIENWR